MFKRNITVLFAVLSAFLLLSFTAFAGECAEVKVDSGGITVSGELGSAGCQYIAAVFSAENEDEITDSNIGSILVGLSQGKADENGRFETAIPLGYSIPSGNYVVEISTSGNFESVISLGFYFMSKEDITNMTGKFNSAASADELETLTEKYASELNISFEGLFEVGVSEDDIYKRMLALKNKEAFADSVAVKKAFDEACVMSALENAESSEAYANLVEDYSELLGVEIAGLSDEVMLEASSILSGNEYELACDLAADFEESVCAARFNLTSREDAGELIEEYKKFIDLPSEYNKSGTSAKEKRLTLYKKIENKTDFETYNDISDFIDKFYDNYDDGKRGGSSGGSSGGGSGKATATIEITPQPGFEAEAIPDGTSQLTPATNFGDLAGFEWALEAIEALANSKVILGVSETSYEPARSITREEFVKMLVVAFDIPSGTSVEFTDVAPDAWYKPYVSAACSAGITEGMGDGSFGSGRGITRQEMAVMMNRIITLKGIEASADGAVEFEDSPDIAPWAADAVNTLTANKILNGVSKTDFAPQDGVNRAMAAKAVYGLMEFTGKQEDAGK